MATATIDQIRDILDQIGKQTQSHLQDKIKSGSFATGSLYNSIRHDVTTTSTSASLTVYAGDAFFFVEGGRRKGAKMPPAEPIAQWMSAVGIDPKLNWVIRKSIARKGIAPKHYLKDWIGSSSAQWRTDLDNAAIIDLTARFTERFRDLPTNKA